MAVYDLISVEWSDGCNVDNIYYKGGFVNRTYFEEDLSPEYEIDDEGKKAAGTMNAERQIWYKNRSFTRKCTEAEADVLTTIPLAATVVVTDKDGNSFTCAGPDIQIDVQRESFELIQKVEYPIMAVTITFIADTIIKSACCDDTDAVECSDVLPTITGITEPVAGQMLVNGVSPANMLVRSYYRELFDQVNAETGGKINDVCWVDTLIAFCCTNSGKIYKTIDAGNTWTLSYNGVLQLNSVAYDGLVVYAGGIVDAGESTFIVTADGGINWTPIIIGNQGDITAFDAYNGSYITFCTASGKVFLYDGSLSNVSPAGAGTLRDICINKNDPTQIMVVGTNFYAYTANSGGAWTTYATIIDMYCVTCTVFVDTWIMGTSMGVVYRTSDSGANISTAYTFAVRCCGLTWRAFGGNARYFACDINGNVIYSDDGGSNWSTVWKTKSVSTCNRIRAHNSSELKLMLAIGNGKVATTQTPYAAYSTLTAAEYNVDGTTIDAINNVSYQVQVETYLLSTDPCAESTVTIFTT